MDDADFIVGLMRTESDALGFIPEPALRSRWIANGRYVIQRDHRGKRRGYLLWGPMRPGKLLFVNQVCIEYDHRRRGHAIDAVDHLLAEARISHVAAITLRCARDLPAVHFWQHQGFRPIAFTPGGKRRNRQIVTFHRDIQSPSSCLFRTFPLQTHLLGGIPR